MRLSIFIFLVLTLYGCGSGNVQPRRPIGRPRKTKFEKPEEITVPEYTYGGIKYRSPFSASGAAGSSARYVPSGEQTIEINPESLKVTGFISDSRQRYAILSGPGEYYIVKQGRLYNEDEKEVPGVAAIVKENKVMLITDKNTVHELIIPD